MSIDGLDLLGVDAQQRLYWDGKPVKTGLNLDWLQTAIAIMVAVGTVVAALATLWQAWTAYQDWACKAHLPGTVKCPPEHVRIWSE